MDELKQETVKRRRKRKKKRSIQLKAFVAQEKEWPEQLQRVCFEKLFPVSANPANSERNPERNLLKTSPFSPFPGKLPTAYLELKEKSDRNQINVRALAECNTCFCSTL